MRYRRSDGIEELDRVDIPLLMELVIGTLAFKILHIQKNLRFPLNIFTMVYECCEGHCYDFRSWILSSFNS